MFSSLLLSLLAQSPDGLEYFEKSVRPLLAARCYDCHSSRAKKLRGGLRLDFRGGWSKGGDSGPALVPGKPDESLLVKAVRYGDKDLRMPPKGKLDGHEIAVLEEWVRRGAPDPRGDVPPAAAAKKMGMSLEEGRKFWAYRLPVKPAPPPVRNERWAKDDLDRFILARLETQGLDPAPPAAPTVLLRRLHLDLVGLPPSPEDIDAFVADPDVAAAVDRLLASPHFGERWGRHWLDVARFAESVTLRGFVMGDAWRYRDYVIGAFNADLPFDRFVREQVAGDLLPHESLEDRRRKLVAVTFLLMGNSNLENQDKAQLEVDVVDEQLEVIGRAVLAQTITCARCHDHKFDPIPTRDYYALAGILKNSITLNHSNVSKWIEAPLPAPPEREAEIRRHEKEIAALGARLKAAKDRVVAKKRKLNPTGIIPVSAVKGVVVDDAQAVKVGDWKHSTWSGNFIGAGYVHDLKEGKGRKSLTFEPKLKEGTYEVKFAYSHGSSRPSNVPVTILTADGEKTLTVNQKKAPPVEGRYVSLGRYRFENNQGYVVVSNEGTVGHVTADAVVWVPIGVPEQQQQAKPSAPADSVKGLEAELKRLRASGPKRETAMALREAKVIRDLPIHLRGNVHTLGETAPRGFLQVALHGDVPEIPTDRGGRAELAAWLSGPQNPLTARVMVNRAWHWLFGSGLVRTTDNFGTTGERPSHPKLLDFLAVRFVEEGWSVKTLVRRIATSATYRMSSRVAAKSDPENRLFHRSNRRRLDAECLRDGMLQVAGRLRLERGGPSFPASVKSDYNYAKDDLRRSVYQPVFRNSLPEIFDVFDFANPSMPTGRRDVSTVAPQALYFMNAPFVREQARHAAERLLAGGHGDDRARVVRAYRRTLGRPPGEAEAAIALRHVAGMKDAKAAWAEVFHALFSSIEFRYVE